MENTTVFSKQSYVIHNTSSGIFNIGKTKQNMLRNTKSYLGRNHTTSQDLLKTQSDRSGCVCSFQWRCTHITIEGAFRLMLLQWHAPEPKFIRCHLCLNLKLFTHARASIVLPCQIRWSFSIFHLVSDLQRQSPSYPNDHCTKDRCRTNQSNHRIKVTMKLFK